MSGPEPREPGWSHQLSNCQPFRGPELGWLLDREAPTPRPSLSNAEACPLVPGRPASSSRAQLLSQPAWNCQVSHKLPEPEPVPAQEPNSHHPGLPTKTQVRLWWGGGGGFLLMPRYFFGLLQAGRQEDIPTQAITCIFGPLCTHLPKGKIIIVKANMWDKRWCQHFTTLVLQAQNSP